MADQQHLPHQLPAAAAPQSRTAARSWSARVLSLLPFLLLLLAAGLIASQVRRPAALLTTWVPWIEIATIAVSMTPIVMLGGIDLSVGSAFALTASVFAFCLQTGTGTLPAIAIAVMAGTACGSLNGTLIARGSPPLLVTLASMALFRGLTMSLFGGERILVEQSFQLPGLLQLRPQYYLLLLVLAALQIIVHHRVLGRWILATGENRTAARIAGVPDRRVDLLCYATCGFVVGLVAVLNVMQHNVAVPDAGLGMELQAIACIIVGGTVITGGRGRISGTLLGAAVVSSLDIALNFLSTRFPVISLESRMIVTGILLIGIAVSTQKTAGTHPE